MKANHTFSGMPKSFWASVRSISQEVGYSTKNDGVTIPSVQQIRCAFLNLGLDQSAIIHDGEETKLAKDLISYFAYRADILNNYVEPRLMDAVLLKNDKGQVLNNRGDDTYKAVLEYEKLKEELNPTCPIPMNKQKGDKKAPAYFTSMINMLVEANSEGIPCDYDPRQLTTVTLSGTPLRTLARRVDGAFPGTVNPIAIWEIKEYYYTTTFGSRVADGVYETLLDGMELEELHEDQNINVLHYLMIDSHYTWWQCGKPYLCRIIDMLHMNYVDEVLFGSEITERLPELVKEWVEIAKQRAS